jgi:hypothetical protein
LVPGYSYKLTFKSAKLPGLVRWVVYSPCVGEYAMLDESASGPGGPPPKIAANSAEGTIGPGAFVNHYRCPFDNAHWAVSWSCTCDDKCPNCGREIEPYESLDL